MQLAKPRGIINTEFNRKGDIFMANVKRDMGTGSVKKLMVQMAVPALVGQVVNLLYNIVDRIYIGHLPEIGGTALTGVVRELFFIFFFVTTTFGELYSCFDSSFEIVFR